MTPVTSSFANTAHLELNKQERLTEVRQLVSQEIQAFNDEYLGPINHQLRSIRQSNDEVIPSFELKIRSTGMCEDTFKVDLLETGYRLKKPWLIGKLTLDKIETSKLARLSIGPKELESDEITFLRHGYMTWHSASGKDLDSMKEIIEKHIVQQLPDDLQERIAKASVSLSPAHKRQEFKAA